MCGDLGNWRVARGMDILHVHTKKGDRKQFAYLLLRLKLQRRAIVRLGIDTLIDNILVNSLLCSVTERRPKLLNYKL